MKLLTTSCLLFITFSSFVNSQTTVGWESSCSYNINDDENALQQAITDGNTDIRLTNQGEYLHAISIRNQVQIKGGYSNCQEAMNGNQTNENSIINAALDDFYSGIFVFDVNEADILLDSLTVKNATYSGVYISKITGTVTLKNLNITSNTGSSGGGIYVNNNHTAANPGLLTIDIENSIIQQNNADTGGGIECAYTSGNVPIKLNMNQGTVIHGNHSENNGGGLNIWGCELQFNAGLNPSNNGDLEIFNNTAGGSGGGISSQDSVININGDSVHSFDIQNNEAGFNNQNNASGGGVFVVGSANLNLINTNITSNKAKTYGAGLMATSGTRIIMDIDENRCDYDDYCSTITGNQLLPNSTGGAAMAATGGSIEVNRTLINLNNSDGFGYISYIKNDAELVLEGNLILGNASDQSFANNNGIYQADTSSLSMYYNTTSRNSNSVPFIRADDSTVIALIGNIIDEFSDILHSGESITPNINCNMMAQTENISVAMTDTIVARADFVDGSIFGNFQLHPTSTHAMDICSFVPYMPSQDLANNQRGMDNPDVIDTNGVYDLGAYEFIPVTDRIFKNGFEQ